MNKKIFVLPIMFASLLTLSLLAVPNVSVLAQAGGPGGCIDPATGGSVECPPTDAPTQEPSTGGSDDSGGGSGSGNQNPPASVVTATFTPTATPIPTSTPLPFAMPESDYLGTCTSDNFLECKEQFKCEDGLLVIEVDLYSGNGTKYDFYCIPHESDTLREFPLTQSLDEGDTDYGGVCHFGDGFDKCVSDFLAQCDEDGGLYNEIDSGKGAVVTVCELPQQAIATEVPEIVAAPTDDGNTEGNEDWDEQCSWASCWAVDLACWMDGGSGYGIDDGAGGVIYHCDVPAESSSLPPSSWFPWVSIGIVVLLVGMLLPAVQKARQAAARSKDKDKKWIEIESMNSEPKNTSSNVRQTKEHVLLNKDDNDSSSTNKPKPKPKPTPPPSQPSSSDLETWRDNHGQSSSQSKPKPKPTPPPSQPRPSSGPKGDFNSDGDVNGSDFNP